VKDLHSEDCAAVEKEMEDTRREKDSSMLMGWQKLHCENSHIIVNAIPNKIPMSFFIVIEKKIHKIIT
jgi:hypothetical protein